MGSFRDMLKRPPTTLAYCACFAKLLRSLSPLKPRDKWFLNSASAEERLPSMLWPWRYQLDWDCFAEPKLAIMYVWKKDWRSSSLS